MMIAITKSGIVLLIALFSVAISVSGQQDYHFTQFNFNKLALNPAYAGTDNQISLTAAYRRQWSGLDGAPQSITFSGHAPVLHQRIGFGVLLYDDRIGVDHQLGIFTTYSYKVPLGRSVLSLGLQAGMLNYRTDLTELDPLNSGDQAFSSNYSAMHPNFGFGVYWYQPGKGFAGLSIPRLIENDLSLSGVNASAASLYRHAYLMGGYVFRVNSNYSIRPSAMIKYAGPNSTRSPVSMDINFSALLLEKLWVGVGWRPGDSFDAMAELLITEQFMLGYAHDFGVNSLAEFHGGSHEIVVRYNFAYSKNSHVSPRQIKYF